MKRSFLALSLGVFTLILAACGDSPDTFIVGLECNYAPYNWTTSEMSGEPIDGVEAYCDGYDIAIARELAADLELDLVVKKIDWDGLIPALTSGTIDAIIAGMSPTAERAEVVQFSDPYFRSEQVFVVASDSRFVTARQLSDFTGADVVAQLGTLQNDLIEQIPGVNRLSPLNDYPSLVAQVTSGIADAIIAELPVATSIVASNPALRIVNLGANGFTLNDSDVTTSVAVRLDDTELAASINAILASLSDEARNQLMTEALENQPSS